jgi:hypothetical protein
VPTYDAGYAILRYDIYQKPEHMVTVKKVVWDLQEAIDEVARLNGLVRGKLDIHYGFQYTRVDKRKD